MRVGQKLIQSSRNLGERLRFNGLRGALEAQRLRAALGGSLRGQHCFVLGSAPEPDLSGYRPGCVLVTANGSAVQARALGLPAPRLTVIDAELLMAQSVRSKETRRVVHANQLLRDVPLGTLVNVSSNGTRSDMDPACLGAELLGYHDLSKAFRCHVVQSVCGCRLLERRFPVDGIVSTGMFAVLLCCYLGARSVAFGGFRIFSNAQAGVPHFYQDLQIATTLSGSGGVAREHRSGPTRCRVHSQADLLGIGLARIRGHAISTGELEFQPVLVNFGGPSVQPSSSSIPATQGTPRG